jgi:hypothetical protein
MRDLAKSLMKCSWAVSVLGAREATRLLTGSRVSPMKTFDAMSHTAEDQMGATLSGVYRAGEQLQNGMFETVTDLASGSWSDPAGVLNKGMRKGWETLDRSWSSFRSSR